MSGGEPYLIRPFNGPIDATVIVPGSKSFTNRALVTAALAHGTSVLRGVLDSDDTQAMIGCLRAVGIGVTHDPIAATVEVIGCGGVIPVEAGSVDVRQSGTTARFITPMLSLANGQFVIDGHEQMRKRPMNELTEALRSFGVRIEGASGEDRLPFRLTAAGVTGGVVSIPGNLSSQFLSGLLLSAPCFAQGLDVRIVGDLVSKPYVDMTIATMQAFGAVVEREKYARFVVAPAGYQSADYQIEPDASAASYFFAAAAITGGRVRIDGLGTKAVQGDVAFVEALEQMGATVTKTETFIQVQGPSTLHGITVNMEDYSDTAQTLAAVAAYADSPTSVTGIGFIRFKETDRLSAVVTEMNRAGIHATVDADGFTIIPGKPQPTVIHTYDDHRMAMSFSLLGLRSPGISIENPGCVAKTFPTYFTVFESVRPNADANLQVVAIDGVLGAGKTTVARKLAKSLSLEYLDTGAMYRSIGLACLRAGLDLELRGTTEFDADAAHMALSAQIEVGMDQDGSQFVLLDGDDVTTEIREPHVAMAASAVATVAGVRTALVEQQRAWARRRGGGVLEGRDIATAVFPSAPVKIFLTADVMERAKRRHAEQPDRTIEEVVADLEARDHQDSTRAVDPLRIAEGATVVDTTGLSIEQVVQRCVDVAIPLLDPADPNSARLDPAKRDPATINSAKHDSNGTGRL